MLKIKTKYCIIECVQTFKGSVVDSPCYDVVSTLECKEATQSNSLPFNICLRRMNPVQTLNVCMSPVVDSCAGKSAGLREPVCSLQREGRTDLYTKLVHIRSTWDKKHLRLATSPCDQRPPRKPAFFTAPNIVSTHLPDPIRAIRLLDKGEGGDDGGSLFSCRHTAKGTISFVPHARRCHASIFPGL